MDRNAAFSIPNQSQTTAPPMTVVEVELYPVSPLKSPVVIHIKHPLQTKKLGKHKIDVGTLLEICSSSVVVSY